MELNTSQQPAILRALKRDNQGNIPLWLMRQAGRFLPEYKKMLEGRTILDVIAKPEDACAVTLLPLNHFDVDGLILYADILHPLIGMGLDLEFIKGSGPVIHNPLKSTKEVDRLATPPAKEHLSPTLETVALLKPEAESLGKTLIGFSGAPFTLASYAIEGGHSKNYIQTKRMMLSETAAWNRLMKKLVTVMADYLIEQAKHGAQVLQIFDSWAGVLSEHDYLHYVMPHNRKLVELVKTAGVPVIYFSTMTSSYFKHMHSINADAYSVDWRLEMDEVFNIVPANCAVQGNLDPSLLNADWPDLKYQVERILDRVPDFSRYIFNLGHGVFPETPIDNVRRVCDFVHEYRSVKGAEE